MFEVVSATLLLSLYLLVRISQRRNHTTVHGAPFEPLEPHVVERIMELAKIKPGDVFYDLGSGDGRLVIAAALLGARAYGVEIDPVRVWYSRFCIILFGLIGRARIIHRNFNQVDLSRATVVTTYLLQETNDAIFPKLEKELRPGTRIVSAAFNFPQWSPITVDPEGPIYGPLYLYHVGNTSEEKATDTTSPQPTTR